MVIHYEELNGKNFNTYSLDHFVRHQKVSECWRNMDGQWKLIPIEFEENWTVEQCQKIAADVALHMGNDRTAIGTFFKGKSGCLQSDGLHTCGGNQPKAGRGRTMRCAA